MSRIQPIFDWLVDGAPGTTNPAEVVDRLSQQLRAADIPIDRVEAFVRTLHPHIVGRSFLWSVEDGMQVRENSYDYLQSASFRSNPVSQVFETGRALRHRLDDASSQADFSLLAELAAAGFTDFYAGPLTFLSGQVHAITFATRAPGGFSEGQVDALVQILRPLSRLAEILALGRTAANLLNTYVGHDAGERIMAGQIQRGETAAMRAVIWFSDLRSFTTMAHTMAPAFIIRTLNELFDCQVPAIERQGGQVLKFIGDGLLAILPLDGTDRSAGETCDAALVGAREAFAALVTLNRRRTLAGEAPIQFGLALHVGEVAYGNIGGSGRLDFTCIGPAVNLASRLEGLAGKLDSPLIISHEFAQLTAEPVRSLGTFDLKGLPEPVEAFTVEEWPSSSAVIDT